MALAHVSHRGHPVALHGQVTGATTVNPTIPDVGGSLTFHGSGSLRQLGSVQATGTFHTPGFIAVGHTTASVVLTNTRGSINVNLTSGPEQGFSGPDGPYTYTIDGGTGAYAHATGHGQATAINTPENGPTLTLMFR
jgi:hypothetical protein